MIRLLVERVNEPVEVTEKVMTEPETVKEPSLPGVKLVEPSDAPMPRDDMPKIDPKDKGKAPLIESPKKKKKHILREDEELARRLQEEELKRAELEENLFEVEVNGRMVKLTKEQVARYDELMLKKAQQEDNLEQLRRKREEEMAKKKQTKPRTKAQIRNDMMRQLKGLVPGLVRMSYEEIKTHYDRYQTRLAPMWRAEDEARRNKVEIEKKRELEKKKGRDMPMKQILKEIDEYEPEPETMPAEDKPVINEPAVEKKKRVKSIPQKRKADDASVASVPTEEVPVVEKEVVRTEEPIHAQPVLMVHPVIKWSIVQKIIPVNREEIKLERRGGKVQYYVSFWHMCKNISVLDLNELYIMCVKMDSSKLGISLEKLVYEYITMMFEPEFYPHLFRGSKLIREWSYIRSCGVYHIICDTNERIFMLHNKVYDLGLPLCRELIRVRPSGVDCDELKDLVQYARAQIKKIDDEHKQKSKELEKKFGKD